MEKQTVINILKKNGYERYEPNHYVKGSISVNLEQLSVMKSGDDEVFQNYEKLLDYLGLSGVTEKKTVFIKRYPSKGELPKVNGKYWCKFKELSSDALYQQEWILEFGGFGDNESYDYFLEEIELPSEEEIEQASNRYYFDLEEKREKARNFKGQITGRHPDMLTSREIFAQMSCFVDGANFILNHLKSNTNVETHTQDGGQEG